MCCPDPRAVFGQAFATGGRHLKQAHLGVSVGRTFEPISANLFVTGSYEVTLSEKSDIVPAATQYTQNHSDFDAQLGYLMLEGKLNLNLAWWGRVLSARSGSELVLRGEPRALRSQTFGRGPVRSGSRSRSWVQCTTRSPPSPRARCRATSAAIRSSLTVSMRSSLTAATASESVIR